MLSFQPQLFKHQIGAFPLSSCVMQVISMLGQDWAKERKGKLHVIHYSIKTLNDAQKRYTTTEKELLALVYAFEKFRAYPLLICRVLLLQEFDIKVRDKKGSENLVADHLSRILCDEGDFQALPIDDYMRDDVSYAAESTSLPWFSNIVNYLACSVIPPDFTKQQRRKLRHDAKQFIWDEPLLYKRRSDGL